MNEHLSSLPPNPDENPTTREWAIALSLFFLTIATTSLAGLFYSIGYIGFWDSIRLILHRPFFLLQGFLFSFPLITILLAHELGHYFACRYYGMRCTLPFFLPVPLPIIGTFGAFIKIKSQFMNKRSLFDVGVAGPLAGFIFAIPTLWIGIRLSRIIPMPKGRLALSTLEFGEPLLFTLMGKLVLGYHSSTQILLVHPIAMAAWVGLLATSINLLPIWQTDGGHISYSLFGRSSHRKASIVFLVALMLLSLTEGITKWRIPSYLLFSVLLLILGSRTGFYHPPALNDDEKVGTARIIIGLIALLIFIVSFTPVPIIFH
jgi:membrane-associated protease RseP (regulator of RpoE activity)